ncbi:helix-turn-helix transcriptional regulator [Streptomyces sp. O3]
MDQGGVPLLERQRETDLVTAALDRARQGEGGVVVFDGAAGLGKTGLLRVARDKGAAQGCTVLHARGSEFERDFPWAVVRQLFESQVGGAARGDRDIPALSGPAALARPLFAYGDGGDAAGGGQAHGAGGGAHASLDPGVEGEVYGALHGLYWLCRNLSARRPLLLVVDDAQWADELSLRFVGYLANRVDGAPIVIVLAGTLADDDDGGMGGDRGGGSDGCGGSDGRDLLMAAATSPSARVARLAPLSRKAVADAAAARLGRIAHESFVRACHTATGGNPLHLRELLEDAATRGIEPDEAAVAALHRLTPRRAAWNVRRRLGRLPSTVTDLAGAIAVLGADAEPRHCARVARIDHADVVAAAGALRDAGVLGPGVPYTFHGPLVGQVVYAGLSARERNAAHRRAAHCLADAESAPAAADHLCRTDPGADPWAVRVLRAAAREALLAADPRRAVRHLRRALAEPPADGDCARVLADLGAAELRARHPDCVDHLAGALRGLDDPVERQRVRLDLAAALTSAGRPAEARALLAEPLSPTAAPHDHAATRSLRSVLAWALPDDDTAARASESAPAGVDAAERGSLRGPDVRARAAGEALARGLPARRVARLARSAVAAGTRTGDVRAGERAGERDMELPPVTVAAWALAQCDQLPAAERALAEIARRSAEQGHTLAATTAEALRGTVLLDSGRIAEAETVARAVLRDQTGPCLTLIAVPVAAAALVHCLIETERLAEAEQTLRRTGLAGQLPDTAFSVPLRLARGRLWIRLERPAEGLAELLDCRGLAQRRGWLPPSAACAYLPDAAHALALAEGPHAARKIAAEEIVRARSFGAPRPLAAALRTHSELMGTGDGLARVEEAADLLAALPGTLEHARTLVALGSALRRAGNRTAARRRLTEGMERAHGFGARALHNAARAELRLAGARLTRTTAGPAAALTPAELRVAQKASIGLTNKEISRTLFVTVKTVEWHLSQAYAKLGIGKRSELPGALASAATAGSGGAIDERRTG